MGITLLDQNSKELKELQELIKKISDDQSSEEHLNNLLISIRIKMEAYLNQKQPVEVVDVGKFVKDFLTALNIRNKDFAHYIGYEESNLSAILSGRRRINSDLAMKFGKIFKIDPAIWLHIQSKNDLLEVSKANSVKYDHYKLADLMKETA